MSEPDEAKELRLVNNVELKIALADSDAKLQKLLNIYLAPLLLKLASPHASVRDKVVALCQHINARIKSPSLILPIHALLTQFKDPSVGGSHALIRNFDLMYVTAGLDRIPVAERLEMLPIIARDISKHENDHHQRSLFNILLRLLRQFKPPSRGTKEDTELREKFGFNENPQDAEWLSRWFAKLMLLNLNIFNPPPPPAINRLTRLLGPPPPPQPADPANATCAGLLGSDIDFLTLGRNEETFSPVSVLAEVKGAVLKFLASGAFTDKERFFASLIASVDTNSAVSGPAEDIFKRSLAFVSLDDEIIVNDLYLMLLGQDEVEPVKPTLQVKILGLLSKSRKAVEGGRKKAIEKIAELGMRSTYTKKQQAVFEFLTWVSRMAGDDVCIGLAPNVIRLMHPWLMSPDAEISDHMRAYGFETYTLVASRCMPLVLMFPQLPIIRFLFNRLKNCGGTVASSLERAMGGLLAQVAKENLPEEVQSPLGDLLLETVVEESRAAGQAVKWASRALGFGNNVGRWIAVLAVGMHGHTSEEGGKALHPYYYRLINPEATNPAISSAMDISDSAGDVEELEDKSAFPRFVSLASYFFCETHTLPETFSTGALVDGKLPVRSFAAALAFCKRVAFWEALSSSSTVAEIKVDEDWERNVDSAIDTDSTARALVEQFFAKQLESEDGRQAVYALLDAAWAAMIYDGEGVEGVWSTWNELAVVMPEVATERYVHRLPQIEKLLLAPKAITRRTAASAVGIVGSHLAVESSTVTTLLERIIVNADNSKHGAVLALGALLSRLQLRGRLNVVDKEHLKRGAGAVSKALEKSSDGMVVDAATEALAELELFTIVDNEMVNAEVIRPILEEKAKKGDEKSLMALSYLVFLYSESSEWASAIIEQIIKISESGGVETAFAAGEYLTCACAGWAASAVRRGRAIAGVAWDGHRRGSIPTLLSQMLEKAGEPAGAGKRRATCVTLLSIVEFCGDEPDVQKRLGEIQVAFRKFLMDRDEFIQESAARGLTAVYNLSDEETKSDLVRSLVASFTGEKKEKLTVSRDTQLFEPGQLPTGDGSSVGSYGDIMSLAAELGDPSLVYKFMSLAKSNSVWNSRAAFGRFGLGGILSNSQEVKENRRLWPVLYRYKFDPSPSVRSSMNGIWEALGGNAETVEKWWKEICDECLKGALNGKEWRVREASVGALAELLGGRRVAQYKDRLEEIWKVAFLVLDDVKESVRTAASKLCKVLSSSMIRAIEADTIEKEKREILQILMRFLMGRQGLEANAKETQMFALRTLLQVVKKGGSTLRPWIPELAEKMLTLLSDVEPEVVNYLHLNADKYNTTGEDIDRIRLSHIRQSPIMSTLEELLDTLDSEATQSFIPVLIKCIRTSIALPSKVGCSRVVVSLVMRKPTLLKPFADEVLKACLGAVKDRSETVATTYAAASGYVCRLSSDTAILGAVKWADTMYWEGEEADRKIAGRVIAELYKNATDRANALSAAILPLVFVAKQDRQKIVSEEFSNTWNENTGGVGAVKLYLPEIVELAQEHLKSPRWVVKQTCALALAAAAKSIGEEITAAQLDRLWGPLIIAVGGKSWEGKEKVLEALVGMAASHGALDESRVDELEAAVIREAKRNNLVYRSAALKSLGQFAKAFKKHDLFDQVYAIVLEAITPPDEDVMDVDTPDGRSLKQIRETAVINGLMALTQALPECQSSFTTAERQATHVLDLTDKYLVGSSYELKECSVETANDIVEMLLNSNATSDELAPLLERLWERLLRHARDGAYESARVKAAKGITRFVRLPLGKLRDKIHGDVQGLLAEEKSPLVLRVLETTPLSD